MEPIIKSILDNDLYKASMMNAVLKLFPRAKVRYRFILRSKVDFPEGFATALIEQVDYMKTLFLSDQEKSFFAEKCYYLDPVFFDFLGGYRYDPSEVEIIQYGGNLQINIEGFWHKTIMWEVPLLALVSELYFLLCDTKIMSRPERRENNKRKASLFNNSSVKVADFGTRRRYSLKIQQEVIEDLTKEMAHGLFVGTSNIHLAHVYNLTPIGTEAHEWFMFHAAKYGFQMANELGLQHWTDVYDGDLGTALCDTFTTDSFLKSFNKKYSKLYDGVRQDSGDVYEFANKVITHYTKMGIDPLSKTIVFSDSLDSQKTCEINEWCKGKIKCSFGIGTNLSNDVGATPLNMIIKIIAAKPSQEDRWIPTIKLSDVSGKNIGIPSMIDTCKYILNIN